jgi:hypothetical protein
VIFALNVQIQSLDHLTNVCTLFLFVYFLAGFECVGHSFAYVAHYVFLRDVCIGTQRAAAASRRATNLAISLM